MKILSSGGLLMTEKDKSSCESLLKNSLFSSNMLLNLINDLLDLAKMENSQFHLNNDLFNLHDVINKALDTLAF
jgi:signal transduction histidine kinase